MIEESLRLWRELGDKWRMAVALERVGFMLTMEGDLQTSRARLEEGVSLAREVEDQWPLALCLVRLATPLMYMDAAASHLIREEGVALARSMASPASPLCCTQPAYRSAPEPAIWTLLLLKAAVAGAMA